MKICVISCSLHPNSRSYVLAQEVAGKMRDQSAAVDLYDLRNLSLDFCDATTAHHTPDALTIIEAIRSATAILLAVPVYNYDVNSAAKNLLEIGLRAWNHKLVGFLCAAGGRNSYMSVMGLANSLMLDFRCIIIPRFVYATGSDFGDDRLSTMHVADEDVQARILELATTTISVSRALAPVYPPAA